MSLLRPEIENLQPSGIARIALPRFTDTCVIPLWIGEGDMVTPEFIREAAKRALEEGEAFVQTLRSQYAGGRDIVMDILGRHPRIALCTPEGAFYAFPRLQGMHSSLEFAEGLLRECDVGVAPGYTFGPGNEEHFRLCFAQSHQRLTEALRRIVTYIDRQE
jgi:aspartate/methionine/tyrosine aminotransferase